MLTMATAKWINRAQRRFILVADESGQLSIRDSPTRKAVLAGGLVIPDAGLPVVRRVWGEFKHNTFGDRKLELKGRHFYESDPVFEPLPGIQGDLRRKLIENLLVMLMDDAGALPCICTIDKAASSPEIRKATRRGGESINIQWPLLTVATAFALFLENVNGYGRIIWDRLGGKQEGKLRQCWRQTQAATAAPEELRRIARTLRFQESHLSAEMQVADLTLAVFRSAFENGTPLAADLADRLKYARSLGLCSVALQ
jgi:hypothetical protein